MQTSTLEQEILSTVHGLPKEIQEEVLKFSLSLKHQFLENSAKPSTKISIPTFYGDGLKQGVDLTNSRAIQNLLDEDGIAGR